MNSSTIKVVLSGCLDGCDDPKIFEFDYSYTKRTLIKRLIKECQSVIKEGYPSEDYTKPTLSIVLHDKGYWLDSNIQLYKLIDYFELKTIHINYISGIGEGYAKVNGITYLVHSNEDAHTPHIHAKYQGDEISISLLDYSVKGQMKNPKKEKEALNYVKKHRESMVGFYNINTNGVLMTYEEVLDYEKRKMKQL